MSTVKISELPAITRLNSNTANTLIVGVDIPTGVTGKINTTVLAESLYSNNVLNVGNNNVIFPGVIGQFVSNNETYLQINLQNLKGNGSSDYVATADVGTDTVNYIDMGIAGSTDDNASYPIIKRLDGYLYVQGNTSTTSGGNLLIGTITTHRDITFFQGGAEANNAIAKFVYNSGLHLLQKPLTFADGTTQNTSFDAAATAANAAFLKANTPSHVANSAALYANGAFSEANAAFNKANNALANTTGTFAGSLTITNNLTTGGIITIANSGFSATQGLVTISASNTGVTQVTGGDGYVLHMTGKHNVPVRVVSDSFGANGQLVFPIFGGRAARGNVTNPTAVQTNDVLTRIAASGFGTTSYQTGGTARIDFIATENYTDTARGTAIKFYNISIGSNTISQIAEFNANNVSFTGAVIPQKGFVYTPNVQATITTFAVDFNRDSLIKFNVTTDATITLSNYVYGKVVEIWITNSGAQNRTITHGCLSNNSTNKSTTFTITASSCAYLKYFSIDGDQANTFVSIVA